jgi:hypothetical protein
MQPTNNPLALANMNQHLHYYLHLLPLRPLSNLLDNGWCAGGYWLTQTPLAVPRVHEPNPVINMVVCPIPQHMSTFDKSPNPMPQKGKS